MKVYLAGPMRGIPAFNFPAFASAAHALRTKGLTVVSPHEMDEAAGYDFTNATGLETFESLDFDIDVRLAEDIETIARCDAVVCLQDWTLSYGAKCEVFFAFATGRKVFQYDRPDRYNGFMHCLQEITSSGAFTNLVGEVEEW